MKQKDDRILLKNLPTNIGLAAALNIGFEMALAIPEVKYIARMDADDISLPYRLRT